MTLYSAILALIWPWAFPQGLPESTEHYELRLQTIAQAWATTATSPSEAAAGIVTWREESRFRLDIHAGTKKGDHGRATCLGSIHPWHPNWPLLAGTSLQATTLCAQATRQALRSGLWMCAKGLSGQPAFALAFEYYARGTCQAPGTESLRRAAKWATIVGHLHVGQ